jgi:hypothetical protein
LNKPLKLYVADKSLSWEMSGAEWLALREFEGVMNASRKATVMVQFEQPFMGSMGFLLHDEMLRTLRASNLSVFDLDAATAADSRKRVDVAVTEFTELGKECLARAKLEAERCVVVVRACLSMCVYLCLCRYR